MSDIMAAIAYREISLCDDRHPCDIKSYLLKEAIYMAITNNAILQNTKPESAHCEIEPVVLPQIASIKQASAIMGLPVYYVRRLCKEVPGIAFQSGVKWYINLGRLADYYNGQLTERKT